MDDEERSIHERWAVLRFAIVAPLLATPPEAGALQEALRELSEREWKHPRTGEMVRFGVSTIERWGRGRRVRELCEGTMSGTTNPETISTKQARIANIARQRPNQALTPLSHHIDLDWLREARSTSTGRWTSTRCIRPNTCVVRRSSWAATRAARRIDVREE